MDQISEKISNIGIVPVITLHDPQRDAAPLARALCAGGVPVAEVAFRTAGAEEAIKRRKRRPAPRCRPAPQSPPASLPNCPPAPQRSCSTALRRSGPRQAARSGAPPSFPK